MFANMSYPDRMVRAYVGLIVTGLTALNVLGEWGWLGLIPLAAGLLGFCPLYTVLRVNFAEAEIRAAGGALPARPGR